MRVAILSALVIVICFQSLLAITTVPFEVMAEREKLPTELSTVRDPYYPAISITPEIGSDVFREYQAYYSLPEMIWPHIAVDIEDRIHLVVTFNNDEAGTPQSIGYLRSDDLGRSWTEIEYIDTVLNISPIVAASRHSNKVAIVYCHPITASAFDSDVLYLESPDGVTWSRSAITNITNFTTSDTIRAYCDVDAIYDEEDNLHIVFNAIYSVGGVTSTAAAMLMHWSEATGLDVIASGWYDTYPGSWHRTICKPNLGINPVNGNLYATWTQFLPGDISAGGYSNGEICASVSTDNGDTWEPAHNLTRTTTPGCYAGECNSDHWASLAEIVDGTLHIVYINDKDAGGIPQGEGTWTNNPVKYLAIPAASLMEEPPTTPNEVSPGMTVGHTWYDYQHNSSMGKSIAVDDYGGVHLIFMKGYDAGASERHVMYNYKPRRGEFR